MDGLLLVALLVLVCLEGIGLGATTVLWLRSRRQVESLEVALESAPDRRWLPSGREAVKTVWQTAALVGKKGVGGALRSSIEELAGWAQVEQPDLARLAAEDGTVAILFSDIEGSTALNEELGDKGWIKLLQQHDEIVRRSVKTHAGHVIKTQGDGFMVAFGSAEDAVRCAIDIERALRRARRRPLHSAVRVRIGIHRGAVVHRDGDLFGRNVALAARVASQAGGEEILVSDAVRDALHDLEENGPEDVVFGDVREVDLKGLSGTHHVHAIEWAS